MQYEIGNRSITQLLHEIDNLVYYKIKFSNYLLLLIISCVNVHPICEQSAKVGER